MGVIISFFNHKGGIGKTTLVNNSAFDLARQGKRVLIIDADSQMNLTASTVGFSDSVRYTESIEKNFLDVHQDRNKESFFTSFLNTYLNVSEYFTEALLAEENTLEKKIFSIKDLHPRHQDLLASKIMESGKIDLLCGSIEISRLDYQLFNLIMNKSEVNRRLLNRFIQALYTLARKYDFVLIDTAPNAVSMINALFVMCGDYFVVPAFPTFFSLQAIDNLPNIIETWSEILAPYISTVNRKGFDRSKFLGLFLQMAKFYKQKDGSKESQSAKKWIDKINQRISDLVMSLLERGRSIDKASFKRLFPKSTPFVMAACNDFTAQLRDITESEGLPLVMLNDEICVSYKRIKPETPGTKYHKPFKDACTAYHVFTDGLLRL